MLDYSETVSL